MNHNRHFRIASGLFLVLLALPRLYAAQTATGDGGIVSPSAAVEASKLHYWTAGHGSAVILLLQAKYRGAVFPAS